MSEYSSFVKPMDVYTSVVMAAISRSISFAALLLGSFGAVIGCRPSFEWQGSWSGTRNLAIVPGTAPEVANSVRRVTLVIKENGEYELHTSGVPTGGFFHGSGKQATLEQITKFNVAQGSDKPITLTAKDDSTITLSSPDSFDSGPITLHRESQPTESNVRKQ
jgi:hypothetical protein